MDIKINYKILRLSILIIIALELASLLGYFYSEINLIFFLLITGLVLLISIWRLEWGVLILLIELFISSKGYLFYIDLGSITVSIRIALWLVVMGVWLTGFLTDLIKKRKLEFNFLKNKTIILFSVLFFFIIFAFINGLVNKNGFNNIFFDANGWFYFALLFPMSRVYSNKFLAKLSTVFLASILWLSAKTLLLLYLFSHQIPGLAYNIYRWVRTSGVGEITQLQGGFYRIFFQSHIFIFIAFFIVLLIFIKNIKEKANYKIILLKLLLLSFLFSVILISFSRSNWIGLVIGSLISLYYIFAYFKLNFKQFMLTLALALTIGVLGLGIIIGTVKFPLPKPIGGFSTAGLLKERAGQISAEAAVSSRWKLLPVLWDEIKSAPIIGCGFGKTISYQTDDPRARQNSVKGDYTTYAFEWGWLDIWLKLGLFGLFSYAALIAALAYYALRTKELLAISLAIGLIVISVIHFFSPYLNHPLGIGYLLLASLIINQEPARQIK